MEIRDDSPVLCNEDNINLFQICRLIYNHTRSLSERKKQIIEYAQKNEVREEVLKAAGAAVGKKIEFAKKGEKTMCTFFDELERECEKRGQKVGMMKKAVRVVKNLMQKQKFSLEEACELAEISVENYRKYANA